MNKITILTVCYNSVLTLEETIKSVLDQEYKNIEYILVDGGSTDGTLEIIGKYHDRISRILVERDKGIYDAMNKGIALATGDIIGFLNSDDVYADEFVLTNIASAFSDKTLDAVYGNLDFVKYGDTSVVIRKWQSSDYVRGSFLKGWHPPHPTFYVRNWCYKEFGAFDLSLNVSADFELMLRFFEVHGISSLFLNITFVKMRYGGESTRSLKNILRGNRNIIRAFRKNNFSVSYFYIFNRLLSKGLQFLKR